MFRNYLAAALRNLARNPLYAAINILGLAVGFSAAILIALFVRDEFSYESWIPGYQRIYLATKTTIFPGQTPKTSHIAFPGVADWLRQDLPVVQATSQLSKGLETSVGQDSFESIDPVNWADPNFFDVVPLPSFAGDLKHALMRPDGVVLTRSTARKYFGRENVLGETLEFDRRFSVRVTAIIEDLPPNTHFKLNIIGSRLAAFFEDLGKRPPPANADAIFPYVYMRATSEIPAGQRAQAMADIVQRHLPNQPYQLILSLVPLAEVHFSRENGGSAMRQVDDRRVAYALLPVGILILLMAGSNFVNLTTARATRRMVEVGVRKTTGAFQRDVMFQFMGEALLYAAFGMIAAVALTELLLPSLNAFLDRNIAFDLRRTPGLAAALLGATVVLGALAGFYPALFLSAVSPASAVKREAIFAPGFRTVAAGLVIAQFAILIGLLVSTLTMFKQTQFALNEGLRADTDQVILIRTSCKTAFPDLVRSLPGVRAAACSRGWNPPNLFSTKLQSWINYVDFGFFELYGIGPVAGRVFTRDHPGDAVTTDSQARIVAVVNESATRQLGFATPAAAVGGTFSSRPQSATQIVGVVPDFSWDSIRNVVPPTFYLVDASKFDYLNVKLRGRDLPETLQTISRAWKDTGDPRPMTLLFLDQEIEKLYLDITRQGRIFAAFSAVAIVLSCLGLVGLAISIAERRTKEIGVRKSMGASNADILRLLSWQFARPVLLANLIAWPIAWWAMRRWLNGFASHIDLAPWMFVTAGGIALAIALATVSFHAWRVARAVPATALRYE
jgi:putative ABC transport system permease protein